MIQGPPEDIIQQSIDSIEIEPELLTLDRIEDTIKSIKTIRNDKIEQLTNNNHKLLTSIEQLNQEIKVLSKISDYNYEIIKNLTTIHNANIDYHTSEINKDENMFKVLSKKSIELDDLKVLIAKNLNDLESSINSLKLNKNNLTKELNELKLKLSNVFDDNDKSSQNNESQELLEQDSSILQINLFRNLGVRIETFDNTDLDDSNIDNSQQSTSSSSQSRSIDHIIIHNKESNLTNVLKVEPQYSDYFISNYVWERLEGYN
ncbi:Spc24 subunit of Ndc80-domain-containing protein [Scheffersomyces coipomensis]|uniref:Spc24 subunit of Ndc80-domain-containing protein n=1 Tax=Scheffersomyces coipomensis TaxID=1788519 RepID=UPI00315C9143